MQKKGWHRSREMALVLALVAIPTLLYLANSRPAAEASWLDRTLVALSSPLERAIVATLDGIDTTWRRYVNLTYVAQENEHLKATVDRLVAQNARLVEDLKQMETLRRLLAVSEKPSQVQLVHAEVIAASPSPLFRSVRINRGEDAGVGLGAAVLSYEGVVGRVAALFAEYADVMLLTDANSSTDVLVQRTRARARVRGQGGDNDFAFDAQYLDRTAEVEPGDLLVTGGLGRTFPKGLSVGRVLGIERRAFGLYQRAVVQPSVDFTRLEHVLVVVGAPSEAP